MFLTALLKAKMQFKREIKVKNNEGPKFQNESAYMLNIVI